MNTAFHQMAAIAKVINTESLPRIMAKTHLLPPTTSDKAENSLKLSSTFGKFLLSIENLQINLVCLIYIECKF